MSKKNLQFDVSVERDPEAVINFISDIRNRTKYLQSLKNVSNIQGEPGEVTKSWDWKWDLLGQEFEGIGRTVQFEAGLCYSFVTEGGIESQFSYRAEPEGAGTRLTVDVEVEIPAALAGNEGLDELLASARELGQQSMQKLKAMLEQ